MHCILTIGGLDPSGGAGLPADARACAAFGAHALPVATAVIAQSTQGVLRAETVAPQMLEAQLDHLLDDITPGAVKTGMLPDARSIAIVAARVKNLGVPLIVDPVFAPSSGPRFSSDETIAALCELLLPHAELVTPNWLEAQKLRGAQTIARDSIADLARLLAEQYKVRAVLLKGGHADDENAARDVLWDGAQLHEFTAPRVHGYEVRGTGCMLAAAIAAQRARGVPLPEAVAFAKHWLTGKIQNAQPLGKGRRVAAD